MKRIAPLALLLSLLTTASAFAIDGAWTAMPHPNRPDSLYFDMTYGITSHFGDTMRIAEFSGLTAAQIDATVSTPVNFEWRREPGTISFEGSFRGRKGAGQFTFTPNPSFLRSVAALGVENDVHRYKADRSEENQLFWLTMHDVSTAFIKSMQAIGYRTTLETYMKMRMFGVSPDYVREMKALGFGDLDERELIESRIHRVTPEYVRTMRAAGYDLDLRGFRQSAIHGMTPAFAQEMKKAGYGNLSFDDLLKFRIHKVTPEFIAELRSVGYDNLSAHDLVSMRIHKVTPDFIRELAAAGYTKVPVRRLVEMRIHKIDVKMLKAMSDQ